MINRIALTSLGLIISLALFAQSTTKWEIGLKAGLNYTDQYGSKFPEIGSPDLTKLYNQSSTWNTGLSAGFQSKLKLSENFRLNADLLYNQRGYTSNTKDTNNLEVKFSNRFHYLSLPVYGGFQLLPGLDVEIGAEGSHLLASTRNYEGQKIKSDAGSNFDFGVLGGVSYRINPFLSVQGRYYRGLSNTAEIKFTDANGNLLEGNPKFINHGVQISLAVFPF